MKGLKNTVNYFMLFLITCWLVTLDSFNSILFITKKGTEMFLLLTGARVHFFFSNPENKSTKRKKKKNLQFTFRLRNWNMLAKTEGGPAGCRSSLILQQSIPILIARPSLPTHWLGLHARERSHWAGEELCWPLRPPLGPDPGVSDLIGGSRWIPFSASASARHSGCCWLSWGAGSWLQRPRARFSPPSTLA